jgi:heptaprenyl diphosphate synthase
VEKMKLKLLYSDLRPELEMIEKELERAVDSESLLLNDASLHLLQAGGKRIRPVFVLLAGKFGNYDIEVMKRVAVPLELIHMASLVHDDVIDDSEIRRGRPTVKAQWNNSVAMYTGDFILARALERIAVIESPRVHEILSKTLIEVCRGEIIQIKDKYKLDQNLRDYFRRIKRKTALLISSSCELGALVSGTDEKTAAHLRRFGYFIGMSFQIIDDILDFTSTDEELGKPAGSDFIQPVSTWGPEAERATRVAQTRKTGQPQKRRWRLRSRRLITRSSEERHRDQQWRTGPDHYSPATEVEVDGEKDR